MLTLVLLSAVITSHAAQAWGTTEGSCGGSLSGSGSFSSPNYPGNYDNSAKCEWQIQTSSDQMLYLRFTQVELERCCPCDYILVYDGPSVNSRLLGTVCNDSVSDFHSSSNYLTVVFYSDGWGVGRGFKAEFTSSLSSNLAQVNCNSQRMMISVSNNYLNLVGIDSRNLYLNDKNCMRLTTGNGVVFLISPVDGCGTVRKLVGGRIVYTNALRAFNSTQGEITGQSVFTMNVSCWMGWESVSGNIYEVKHSDNDSDSGQVSISGPGVLLTYMGFYTSSSFSDKVTQFPYVVSQNQYMYVQVSLTRYDDSLGLFLDTCVVSPDGLQNRSYVLIQNGCEVDSTFYTYTSSGAAPYARFRFQAFHYLRATQPMYIQCKVLICPVSDNYSRCRRGCLRRKARDLGSEHHVETVVLGPIQLKEEDNGAEEAEQDTKG